ncbi:MAG: carbohydrate kinase family protein [Thermoproteota archaeon]
MDPRYIKSSKILHYSGVALSHSPLRDAVKDAVTMAREAGAKVSFDPNIGLDLWDSSESLKESCEDAFKSSEIILLAKDEMEYFYGKITPEEVAAQLLKKYNPEIVAIKLGGKGCYVRSGEGLEIRKPAFKVKVVDTTGAGDGWAAGFLHGLAKGWDLERCATVANAVGGLVVTKIGAITAMPTKAELLRFFNQRRIYISL